MLETRDTTPYAKILGYYNGYIPDFNDLKATDISRYYSKCIKRALADASIKEERISLVQGCGFGYEKVDKAEAMAVKSLFGTQVPFTSSNGAFGFTLEASGAMSVASPIIQMKTQRLIPISSSGGLYLKNSLNYVAEAKHSGYIDTVLVNCFDYSGCMTALIIENTGA